MPGYFVYNGQSFREGKAVISPDNRSFRYGDGLFETMRIINGDILLKTLHFERLFRGMKLLQFNIPEFFTAAQLEEDILSLCRKNRVENKSVIRLVVFRSDGGLYDLEDMRPNYIIQSMPLHKYPTVQPGESGLTIDVYPDASKACNIFSEVKSNNFLIYVMAAKYARQHGLGDCLVLNQYGRIADATTANVFWVSNKIIYTPPLDEGGVAGVTRKFLLQELPAAGFTVKEQPLTIEDILNADEIFLTNAVRAIRTVGKFRNQTFSSGLTKEVYSLLAEKWQ